MSIMTREQIEQCIDYGDLEPAFKELQRYGRILKDQDLTETNNMYRIMKIHHLGIDWLTIKQNGSTISITNEGYRRM